MTIKRFFVLMVTGCMVVAASMLCAAQARSVGINNKRYTGQEPATTILVSPLLRLGCDSKSPRGMVLGGSPAGKVAGLLGNILKVEHPTKEQIAQLKRRITPGDAVQFFKWIQKKEVFERVRKYLHDYDFSKFLVEDLAFVPSDDEKVGEALLDDELPEDVIGDEKAGDLAYDTLADGLAYDRTKRTQRIVAVGDLCAGLRDLVPARRVRLWDAFVQYIVGVETGNQLRELGTDLFMTKFFEPLLVLEGDVSAEVAIGLFDVYDNAYLVGGAALIRKKLS